MIEIKTLSNKLKIAYERLPHARSVSAGVWVLSGSRYEKISGISHFIEHMLFKGTKTKTAREIAEKMDMTGGQLNAYTTREYTSYYALTVDKSLDEALEVLSDMVINSRFSESDIELEKGVVLEEIAMYEDSPEDLVYDLLEEHAFSGNTLGRSITGSRESVMRITRNDILSHMEAFYAPSNMVLSVAGNFNEDELLYFAEKYFGDMKDSSAVKPEYTKPLFTGGENTTVKEIEQANLAIGYESFGYDNDLRYPLIILNNAFGSSMSSRLFQRIREEEGLAYSVYSSVASYRDIGLFSIYAGLKAENLEKTEKIIREETEKLVKSGLTEEEILRAKKQIAGSLILSGESVSSHMSTMGKGILLNGKARSEDELIEKVEAVTDKDIIFVAEKVFGDGNCFREIVRGK
ncbi:MAG: insulinase family protein [Clostridia bacterium]|nr:insulinase family protein [Clostridia bacterium]